VSETTECREEVFGAGADAGGRREMMKRVRIMRRKMAPTTAAAMMATGDDDDDWVVRQGFTLALGSTKFMLGKRARSYR
jgi:hypothetical protein